MKLELYYYDQCPFCRMVLSQIEKLDILDKINLRNTLTSNENRTFHQQTSGRTTVPCLYIDNKPMFESSDICDWLEKNKEVIGNS